MSVLAPNQREIAPPQASRIGAARDRNQRYWPSAPRSGKVSSQGSPVSIAWANFAATASRWSGWCTDRQPSPDIAARAVPV